MANSSAIKLLVHWGNVHRRPIQIQDDDSLSDIERSCYDLFSVSSRDDTNGFQVQFYDRNFKVYVDLCDGTWNDFQQLRRLLSSQCAPMRTAKEWQLKLVPSMRRPASVRPNAPQMNQAMQMAQQNDDQAAIASVADFAEWLERKITTSPQLRDEGSSHDANQFSDLDLDSVLGITTPSQVNNDTQQRNPNESLVSSPTRTGQELVDVDNQTSTPQNETATSQPKNPASIRFRVGNDLASWQRSQSQSEATQGGYGGSRREVGGCILYGEGADRKVILEYFVPIERHNQQWSIVVYVVFKYGTNYCLHFSKQILDETSVHENRNNKTSLPPKFLGFQEVPLSREDLQNLEYTLELRVFNMSGLPGRRNNGLSLILEDLSPTVRYEKRFKSYLAPKQSGLTAKQIDETGERFCILGFLCCEKSVEAIFISNETTEEKRRNRVPAVTTEQEINEDTHRKKQRVDQH